MCHEGWAGAISGGGCCHSSVGGAWVGGSSSCFGRRSFLLWVSLSLSLFVRLVVVLEEVAEVGRSCPLLLFGLWGFGSSRLESLHFFLSHDVVKVFGHHCGVSFSLLLGDLGEPSIHGLLDLCLYSGESEVGLFVVVDQQGGKFSLCPVGCFLEREHYI